MTLYFAYGSNLNRADMRVRCPGADPVEPARLHGWRLAFRGVADIERAPGEAVEGALWRLTPACVRSLDRYEGAPSHYRRLAVEVETASGPRGAMTYVMTSQRYLGLPSAHYRETIAQGFRDWDLPIASLDHAVEAARRRLHALGVERFRSDGRKRLRAILDDPYRLAAEPRP